ncbi:MAG: hypothetical protein NTX06_05475 [Proteobacteria bacterium]|nr:hypothetical protein [Pseudomonadota bacterium]
MKRVALLLLVVFMMAACSAKAVRTIDPAQTDPREQELRAVIAEAEPLVSNLLASLNTGDYTAYVRDFDDTARAAISEEQFKIFYEEKCRNKLGLHEEGKCQVNKIEKHPDFYMIYYFVKFRNVGARDPVVMAVKMTRTASGLKVSGISYRHALLGT